jgi:hypothetical protein
LAVLEALEATILRIADITIITVCVADAFATLARDAKGAL